ncbi:DUF461 domain-containing protein [Streptomyces sp. NBC_00121]|uniref:DUF461 domain-containing protein n=1 Tax=unclassified Streptomyces TaxID=2593676 RepID=UPI0028C40C18|nr:MULTISPECIES: DUF461 domain-containing protein [unclassified Streptomyces]WNO66232.1 DUF461 domain-containing protein [Streptomyces sp. AM2-3-1]WSC70766.1 DUF461 domain-containing protein [Streptomyces sp. NBC_01760]WTI88658.1 DUF461 domain-containing protein [Streptomyces sp. NBC_00724]
MSRSLRRGALAAAAIVISIGALSACGAGNDAQTLEIKPDNAATTLGDIRIQNANVITQPENGAEGPAVIAATVFNNGTKRQTLDAITLPGSDVSVQLHAAEGAGPVVVPAGGRVVLGGEGNASAVIENGREAAQNGNVQAVVFKFSETGDVPLGAFVVPATSFFKGFGPSSLPKAPAQTPSASPSGTPGAPSGTPSGEAGAAGSEEDAGAAGSENEVTPTDAASASVSADTPTD